MLTYEQALGRILKAVPSPRTTVVRLSDSLGLVLAKPMTAPSDLPLFDNSAVDGYAVRSSDAAHAALRIVGAAEAGRPFRAPVRSGEAVRILTGAQVPQGTDAVVMQEHAVRRGPQLVIQRWPAAGHNIRRRGEDLRRGARVLEAGAVLRPQELGLLAALGVAPVPVYPRPRVAILTTGDELAPPGTRVKPGQIYESNGSLLRALVQQAGAHAIDLGTVQDALASLIPKIRQGLACDLLVIAGGVSVGDKDFVRNAAHRCGVQQLLWQVNIKPGMPLFVGRRGRTLVFGLPGNPVSVFVTFEEFVKPVLCRLMGCQWQDGYRHEAVLGAALKVSATRRTHFIRVRCAAENGRLRVDPLNGQGSHQLSNLVLADGWIRMNADEGPWPARTRVLVKREAE